MTAELIAGIVVKIEHGCSAHERTSESALMRNSCFGGRSSCESEKTEKRVHVREGNTQAGGSRDQKAE